MFIRMEFSYLLSRYCRNVHKEVFFSFFYYCINQLIFHFLLIFHPRGMITRSKVNSWIKVSCNFDQKYMSSIPSSVFSEFLWYSKSSMITKPFETSAIKTTFKICKIFILQKNVNNPEAHGRWLIVNINSTVLTRSIKWI